MRRMYDLKQLAKLGVGKYTHIITFTNGNEETWSSTWYQMQINFFSNSNKAITSLSQLKSNQSLRAFATIRFVTKKVDDVIVYEGIPVYMYLIASEEEPKPFARIRFEMFVYESGVLQRKYIEHSLKETDGISDNVIETPHFDLK